MRNSSCARAIHERIGQRKSDNSRRKERIVAPAIPLEREFERGRRFILATVSIASAYRQHVDSTPL
jgi:hypothetical protein